MSIKDKNVPPNERHMIDARGNYLTDEKDRSGEWLRTHAPGIHAPCLIFDGILDGVTQHLHDDTRGSPPANICNPPAILDKGILNVPVPCTDHTHSFMFAIIGLAMASMAELLDPLMAGYAGSNILCSKVGQLQYGRWLSREVAAKVCVKHIQSLSHTEARVSHCVSFPNFETVHKNMPAFAFSNYKRKNSKPGSKRRWPTIMCGACLSPTDKTIQQCQCLPTVFHAIPSRHVVNIQANNSLCGLGFLFLMHTHTHAVASAEDESTGGFV